MQQSAAKSRYSKSALESVLAHEASRECLKKRFEGDGGPAPALERLYLAHRLDEAVLRRVASPDEVARLLRMSPNEAAEVARRNPYIEAIIRESVRPVFLINNDTFDVPADSSWPGSTLNPVTFAPVIKTVGRVEVLGHETHDWLGTAFMVAKNVVATNRHVAIEFAKRIGRGYAFRNGTAGRPMKVQIDFKEEFGRNGTAEIWVERVLYIAEDGDLHPDLALLQLSSDTPLSDPVPLSARLRLDQEIAVIGYPAFDSRNGSDAMRRVYGDIYNVKRFAPGVVSGIPTGQFAFHHDASTLGGNSGSCVVDVETGLIVGLHFGGRFHDKNYAVRVDEIEKALRAVNGSFYVVPADVEPDRAMIAALEEAPEPADYDDRDGYQPGFLGDTTQVPFPAPSPQLAKDVVPLLHRENEHILHYRHFSIMMSKSRRMALWTAVNIDGRTHKNIKRTRDKWIYDPRIERRYQIGDEIYAGNNLDRGHQVRRLDPSHGATEAEMKQAIQDTFHWTNCGTQHHELNTKTWNELEDYILDKADAEDMKVCVFTGPVYQDNDPKYRDDVRIPREFYKIVAWKREDTKELVASGYVLSQEDMMSDLEAPLPFGPYKTWQVPIRLIEQKTDIAFGALANYDVFGAVEGLMQIVPIEKAEDLVLR